MRRPTHFILLWLLAALMPWQVFAATTMDIGSQGVASSTAFAHAMHKASSANHCDHHAPHAAPMKRPVAKCGACACCVAAILPSDVHLVDARLAIPFAATPLRVEIAEFLTSGLDRPPRRPARARI